MFKFYPHTMIGILLLIQLLVYAWLLDIAITGFSNVKYYENVLLMHLIYLYYFFKALKKLLIYKIGTGSVVDSEIQ